MASEYVTKHLCNIIHGIYQDAKYSNKTGKLIKEEKLLWDKTIKTWDTVYAICVDKIYNYSNKIIGYIIEDFNGNKMQVKSDDLKIAIALNKIDIVNLSLHIENGILGALTDIKMYNVNSIDDINKCIQERDSWEHYVVGNRDIGYYEVYGRTTLLDYKGYCKEIRLPTLKYTSNYLLSFNDYVKILHIPNSYCSIDLGMCYGTKALSDIYFYYDGDTLAIIDISNNYRYNDTYTKLQNNNSITIHAIHFNMTALNFFDMMSKRTDLTVQLNIRQSSVDTKDPLQSFILKEKMIGQNLFNIDFTKRALISYNGTEDKDTLVLPPVKRLQYRWFNDKCHIGTLYLPKTLTMSRLTTSNIPNKEERIWDASGMYFTTTLHKMVDRVIIPKESSVRFVCDGADKLGIIFETEYGTGTADKIAIKTSNNGIKIRVIELIEYPDIALNSRNTIHGHIKAVIEDEIGNRKSVFMNDLIDKVMDGCVQLTNADILINRTIKIK